MSKKSLPYRNELFAEAVAAYTPPVDAYVAAGFKSQPKSVPGNACRLLRNPAVAERIEELRAENRKGLVLRVEYLQALALPIVEANPLDYFESASEPAVKRSKRGHKDAPLPAADPGRLRFKPLNELRPDQGRAIAGLKLDDVGRVVDVKFHGKTEAMRVLLLTLGIGSGGGDNELSLVELGSRLGAAIDRVKGNGKMIEHQQAQPTITQASKVTAPRDDDVVAVVEC